MTVWAGHQSLDDYAVAKEPSFSDSQRNVFLDSDIQRVK
jgi:hypothetical protein